jgi:hypothetical protein
MHGKFEGLEGILNELQGFGATYDGAHEIEESSGRQ